MRKRTEVIILIVFFILQLLIPTGMIIYVKADELYAAKNGELYKLGVTYMSYDKGIVNVHISVSDDIFGKIYANVYINNDGLASLKDGTNEKPNGTVYVQTNGSIPIFVETVLPVKKFDEEDRYDIYFYNKSIYPEHLQDKDSEFFENGYAEAYIYNGKISIKEIRIENLSLNEFLSRYR